MVNKENLPEDGNLVFALIYGTSSYDKTISELEAGSEIVTGLVKKLIDVRSEKGDKHNNFESRNEKYKKLCEKVKASIQNIKHEKDYRKQQTISIRAYLDAIEKADSVLIEWNSETWMLW